MCVLLQETCIWFRWKFLFPTMIKLSGSCFAPRSYPTTLLVFSYSWQLVLLSSYKHNALLPKILVRQQSQAKRNFNVWIMNSQIATSQLSGIIHFGMYNLRHINLLLDIIRYNIKIGIFFEFYEFLEFFLECGIFYICLYCLSSTLNFLWWKSNAIWASFFSALSPIFRTLVDMCLHRAL